jgi:iron complex transport system substrate-binding protein
VTDWFGDEPFAVWPWAQPKLGGAQPVVLKLWDNNVHFQYDRIAATNPDLVVAINCGVDQDSYNQLSAIAPTVPQTVGDGWFEPWKTHALTVAQAVSASDQMNSLIARVDRKFANVASAHPQFKGKNALLLQGTFYQDSVIASMPGWKTGFLAAMGFQIPNSINTYAVDDRAFIPRAQIVDVLNAADVLIWKTESDAEQAALLADPFVQQLNATAQNRNVFTGKDLSGAIAFSSPLSLPVVAQQLPPLLTTALV